MNRLKRWLKAKLSAETIRRLRQILALVAAACYGWPGRKLVIIGVTGTNGKTSVCHYITQFLRTNQKVGMITTVAIDIAGERQLNISKMTSLNPFDLHRLLRRMVRAGCRYAVIETTSHALDQERVYGLRYHTAVLTNITHDHLDYHQTMAAYQQAKERLFARRPKLAVVNADDSAAAAFLKYPAGRQVTYGILDALRPKDALPQPTYAADKLKLAPETSAFSLACPQGMADIAVPLPGRFTIANVLAAIAVAVNHGVTLAEIARAAPELQRVEGRLEPVDLGQPFSIIVDFAHTPDGLQQVYSTLRPMVKNRLIAVLGSAGNRDKTKRPILGALASRWADVVIVTNEDPGTEDPEAIIGEVAGGIPRGRPSSSKAKAGEGVWWWRVTDRRDAIAKALGMARAGDMVLITGKGGEHVMAVGDKLVAYNDVSVIREIMSRR